VLQLLGWADDDHAIALGCADKCASEFIGQLVLVNVDGSQITPIGPVTDSREQYWYWLLTPR
jgi:hypothetical protein